MYIQQAVVYTAARKAEMERERQVVQQRKQKEATLKEELKYEQQKH